ncbi:hypothetical protein C095_02070 [Fusobacterium necrophorum subsp. funduliforme B35]|uniref:Sodium:alanine symporter family protein n=1 Tax=Fusobacterium necrophorum subsp. funduliforme B35 TaxID=1226633 RepID=A0A0B4E8Y1_9FUSO|nr:hypothetical protein C095_02070 [Fusobacterium necrophorum subsp. funduliforme B35]
MLESVKWMIESVNNFLWGKNILVFLLVGSAIYFSIRTRFMQFRLFKTILKTLFHKEENQKGISSLETFFWGRLAVSEREILQEWSLPSQ